MIQDIYKERKFTETSKNVSDYNNELNLLIKIHELQKSTHKN